MVSENAYNKIHKQLQGTKSKFKKLKFTLKKTLIQKPFLILNFEGLK